MNERKNAMIFVILFVQFGLLMALSIPDSDNTLNGLYDNLLQREYSDPVPFPNHQVERKAQRSPSLRLRFGRRSDPSFSFFQPNRYSDQINKKPIRSPSLRLRFGKRQQPSTVFGDDLYSDFNIHRDIRKPRLRWGKRDDDGYQLYLMNSPIDRKDDQINEETDDLDVQPEKRKAVRLRWGRSFNANLEPQIGLIAPTGNDLDTPNAVDEQETSSANHADNISKDSLHRISY